MKGNINNRSNITLPKRIEGRITVVHCILQVGICWLLHSIVLSINEPPPALSNGSFLPTRAAHSCCSAGDLGFRFNPQTFLEGNDLELAPCT